MLLACVFFIRLRDQGFIRVFYRLSSRNDQLVVHVEFGGSVRGDLTRPDSSNAMFITCQYACFI